MGAMTQGAATGQPVPGRQGLYRRNHAGTGRVQRHCPYHPPGSVMYATAPRWARAARTSSRNIARRTIFTSARTSWRSTGSRSNSQPVSYPVYAMPGERGRVAGYVVVFINMQIIEDSINMLDLGEGSHAYLVDREGRVMSSTGGFEYKNPGKGYRLVDSSTGKLAPGVARCIATAHHGSDTYTGHLDNSVIAIWKWYSYFEWVIPHRSGPGRCSLVRQDHGGLLPALGNHLHHRDPLPGLLELQQVMKPINRIIDTIKVMTTGDLTARTGRRIPERYRRHRRKPGPVPEQHILHREKREGHIPVPGLIVGARCRRHRDSSPKTCSARRLPPKRSCPPWSSSPPGLENVSDGANDQFTSLNSLAGMMKELSDTINGMAARVKDALNLTGTDIGEGQIGQRVPHRDEPEHVQDR